MFSLSGTGTSGRPPGAETEIVTCQAAIALSPARSCARNDCLMREEKPLEKAITLFLCTLLLCLAWCLHRSRIVGNCYERPGYDPFGRRSGLGMVKALSQFSMESRGRSLKASVRPSLPVARRRIHDERIPAGLSCSAILQMLTNQPSAASHTPNRTILTR